MPRKKKEKNFIEFTSANGAAAGMSASAIAQNLCDSLEQQEQLGENGSTTYAGITIFKGLFGCVPNPEAETDMDVPEYIGGEPVSFVRRIDEECKKVHLYGPFKGFVKPIVLDPRVIPYTLPEMPGWPKTYKGEEDADEQMLLSVEEACVVTQRFGVRYVTLKGAVDYASLPLKQSEWVRLHVSKKEQKDDSLYRNLLARAARLAADARAKTRKLQAKVAHQQGWDAEYEPIGLFDEPPATTPA